MIEYTLNVSVTSFHMNYSNTPIKRETIEWKKKSSSTSGDSRRSSLYIETDESKGMKS